MTYMIDDLRERDGKIFSRIDRMLEYLNVKGEETRDLRKGFSVLQAPLGKACVPRNS